MNFQCAIFDLDGVLVDTAKYHYLAWKQLTERLDIPFTTQDNELLKGVSRLDSLNIILKIGEMEDKWTDEEKVQLADEKNQIYVDYISTLDESEILDGALPLLQKLQDRSIKIALGSASKNAQLILENTGLKKYFAKVVDGNDVQRSKPEPEVFTKAAEYFNVPYEQCVVFEDAKAGIEAAKSVGMFAIGIGDEDVLCNADVVYRDLTVVDVERYFS